MTLSAKGRIRKGADGEREIVALWWEHMGLRLRRGRAGHSIDQGDVHGAPELTQQAKRYDTIARAVNDGLKRLREQRTANHDPYGVCWVKRPRGRWVAVMEPEDFFALYRAAVDPELLAAAKARSEDDEAA